jgi:hypothetical protein
MDIGQILVSIADSLETATATEHAKLIDSPPIPLKFTLTQRVLVRMMRENTGASILDSGSAYGRAWQRNLTRDFARADDDRKVRAYTFQRNGTLGVSFDCTIDLFTYLDSRLEYDRALTRRLTRFLSEDETREEHDFPAYIAKERGADNDHVWSDNSYNQDNFLSGTVQFTQFDLDGDEYVILRIHGGCDVRGGYTAPKVFRADDNGCGYFGDWYQGTIVPDWEECNATREAILADLDRQAFLFPEVEASIRAEVADYGRDVWWNCGSWDDRGEASHKDLEDYPVLEIANRSEWRKGTLCVLPDNTALCPETGATLVFTFMH